jgi:hypothetical protein
MRTTKVAFAGTLIVTAMLLASCNDEAAPLAKDTSDANQVEPATAPTGGAAVVDTLPDGPGGAPSSQVAPQPNARLLRPTNLAPRTATRTMGAGVSARIDVFYDELARYGSWVRHPDFSYVWLPGRQGRGWRPYQEGRWLWTDEHGWYWESSEPFAWAVYHYGRWDYDPDLGWFWVPGDTWAPAWVTWHHGGGRTGWAPIAPDRKGFAIGVPKRFVPPVIESWVFVDDRNFADPTLGQYVLPIRQIGAMLGAPSDVDGNRGIRREDIERSGGRRVERREVVYVGNDGDAFEDVRGGRIGIYRPMIEDVEVRQPPHVVVTDVTRVDHVVIREYSDARVAGAPSVALLTAIDKIERQRLQDDRLTQQAAAVDSQIARLSQERAALIEERRREAEHLQAQIEQERQEGALQRKQEQQRLSELRRQRAETITVDRSPAATPAPAAGQPSPMASPQPLQAPAPTEHVPPPAGADAPAGAKPSQPPAVATAPAAQPPATSPVAVPAQRGQSPEAKTPAGASNKKPAPPAASASAPVAPHARLPPPEAKTAPAAAQPVAPTANVPAPGAAPAQHVSPSEAKAVPAAVAQPVPPAASASAPVAPPAQRAPPPEAKALPAAPAPTTKPVPPAASASAPVAPPAQRAPPPEAKTAPATNQPAAPAQHVSPSEAKAVPAAPAAQPVPPAASAAAPVAPPAQRVPPSEAKTPPVASTAQRAAPTAGQPVQDPKSAGKANSPATKTAPTDDNPEPPQHGGPAKP